MTYLVLQNADIAANHTLHLVVKGAAQQTTSNPTPALPQPGSTRAAQSATSSSRSRPSAVNTSTSHHGQTPAGSQSVLHQHPFLQVQWPLQNLQ